MTAPGSGTAERHGRSRLRHWLDAHEVERRGRARPAGSLIRVAFVYLLGFGLPIYVAVRFLVYVHTHSHVHLKGGWTVGSIIEFSLNAVAVLIAVALLAREAPSWARPIHPGPRWVQELKASGLAFLAIYAGSITASLIGPARYPTSHAATAAWPNLVNSLLAGPTEEIVVLVMPIVFLRAAKWPWWAVITAGLALRLAYHVYYGYPALGLLVWALPMMFIYLRSHAVVGMILAHSYWDLSITTTFFVSRAIGALMLWIPALALLVWGIVSAILWLVRLSERRARARPGAWPVGWYQNSAGYWWWWDGQRWLAPPPPPLPVADPGGPGVG